MAKSVPCGGAKGLGRRSPTLAEPKAPVVLVALASILDPMQRSERPKRGHLTRYIRGVQTEGDGRKWLAGRTEEGPIARGDARMSRIQVPPSVLLLRTSLSYNASSSRGSSPCPVAGITSSPTSRS